MKSREALLKFKRFQVEERRRRVSQIEAMIAEFGRMAGDLDREIEGEEKRAGISDTGHFAYPTYAKAARARRDNLLNSAGEIKDQLEEAKGALEIAFEDLKKIEVLDDREKAAERAEAAMRQQMENDRAAARMRFVASRA